MRLTEKFQHWLNATPSPWYIGQICIRHDSADTTKFILTHKEDAWRTDLATSDDPFIARRWVKSNDAGEYRPLKGECNLPHGWQIGPIVFFQLVEVLNIFYPTALANFFYQKEGDLRITPFFETAERQTGMYHIVHKATEEQVQEVVSELCQKRCLKDRLWNLEKIPAESSPSVLTLFCPEVCNFFVAAVREKMKSSQNAESRD